MKHLFVLLLAMACTTHAMAMEKLTVNGTSREMIVYAPENLPKQAPLVIACHGMNQDAPYLQSDSHWEEVADTAKFVVVYANGIDKSWDISGDRDVNFVLAIINEMYSRYGINKNRVYLTGFSMGGMFTYHCANKIADKIAAFGPVSGYRMGGPNATASRPVPIIHTHGTGDDVCVYSGAPTSVKAWAKFDGCDATPQTIKPYPAGTSSPAKMEIYKNGKNGVEVALLTLDGKGHWWSRDESQAHTTREVWNFCKRFSLGKPEPELLSLTPETMSFDLLPTVDSCFTLVYNDTVDTSKATATLTNAAGDVVSLRVGASDDCKVARFLFPEGTSVADGRYTFEVKGLLTSEAKNMQSQSASYEFGICTPAEELKTDTVYHFDLGAEKESIGEGIPTGWRRTMTSSEGTREYLNGPAANITGVRMKYFLPGGDFDAGFYLSARDQSSALLYYGYSLTERMPLDAGDYRISFNSIYWSEGSLTANATFNFRLKSITNETLLNCTSLRSTNTMADNSNQKVSGSKVHSFDFTANSSTNYALFFEMTEGWNSVIFGNIMITTVPSYAERYKGTYTRLLKEANEAVKNYEGQAAVDLQKVIDQYTGIEGKTPATYTAAIKALQDALKSFYATSLSSIRQESDANTIYYNLLGQQVNNPSHGIYICNGRKVVIK